MPSCLVQPTELDYSDDLLTKHLKTRQVSIHIQQDLSHQAMNVSLERGKMVTICRRPGINLKDDIMERLNRYCELDFATVDLGAPPRLVRLSARAI
jgi:hypothetical protein